MHWKLKDLTIRQVENNDVEVAIINPLEAMKVIGNSIIENYANEVNEKLNRVLANI